MFYFDSVSGNLQRANDIIRKHGQFVQEVQESTRSRFTEKNKVIEDLQNRLATKESESLSFAQEAQKKILESLEKVKAIEAEKQELLQMNQKKILESLEKVNAIEVEKQELLQMNQSLRQQIGEVEERAKITIDCLTSENKAQSMTISEKDSIIRNIHEQISRLEQNRESMVFVESRPAGASEMILKSEHDQILAVLNERFSEEIAKNMEFNDLRKMYKDELDCLKVNLASAEELHKQSQATIQTLTASNGENSKRAAQAEREFATARERIDLLNAQVEIYRNDFQMEREAREKIASEKDSLAADLSLLQKRNKELIEESQRNLSAQTASGPGPSSGAVRKSPSPPKSASPEQSPAPSETSYNCPVCNVSTKTLRLLEMHLESCLPE